MRIHYIATTLLALLLGTAPAAEAAAPPVLIQGATVVTGNAEPPREGVDILVEDGVIRAIGLGLSHPTAAVIDARGKTVLPGLIDCHSHLQSVPGSVARGDDADEIAAARRIQLRAYLAAGVTTVLDAAAPPSVLREMRAYTEETNLGPRIEGLAPMLTPENGYFADARLRSDLYADLWSPIGEDLSLIDAELEAAADLDPVGVKVTVEDGYGPLAVWPIFDDAALAYIKKSAAAHETPVFVHAIGADEYVHALKLAPRAFVHGGFMESRPSAETIAAVKESGAAVISTLAIADMILLVYRPDRLEEPWLRRLVPAPQIATAADQAATDRMLAVMARQNTPAWIPDFLVGFAAPWLLNESVVGDQLASAQRATKAMYDAGIPIVMGSDMGNWPIFTSLFHAVGSIREMELLEEAGLPRAEVLTAATARAAALLGKAGEIGTLEPGKRADLVIANENPLNAGMRALRDLAYVMHRGEIRTPDGWMDATR